jgi:hypothetical protein
MSGLQILTLLSVALGAGWCSGINLYATVFVLGAMDRWVPGFSLPGHLHVLSSSWVLWPALGLYVVEFAADKIPAVDTVWDTVHTFVRPPAGAVLAAMALGDVPVELQICAALVGGFLSFGAHAVKATTRLAAHSTGTSPIVSPTVSVAEDVLVVGTLGLIAAHPILALIALVLMMVGAFFLLRLFWGFARKVFGGFRRKPPAAQTC